jgi:hypothetical protein
MCTVTFMARKAGFVLGMNRDEKLSRSEAHAPKVFCEGGRRTLYPFENGGGTWVAVNDARTAFALINWYSVEAPEPGDVVSRGEVVRAVSRAAAHRDVRAILGAFPLKRTRPFRLLGFFDQERRVVEWRWDTESLRERLHAWLPNIWISSGFDEHGAQALRGKTFARALRQRSVGSVEWLRRLHRSHGPKCGPYSVCMHREDAATVSYTEISVNGEDVSMRYWGAAPCQRSLPGQTKTGGEVRLPRRVKRVN